jgi:hypothetical protein
MTMLRNDELQAIIIGYLKTVTAVVALLVTEDNLTGTSEIREDQWQGTEFYYPNIRVRMISNAPYGDSNQCNSSTFSVSIMAYSEEASSQEADKIAGIISTSLNAKSFIRSGVSMFLRTTSLIPAVRSDTHTWRSECLMQGIASKI